MNNLLLFPFEYVARAEIRCNPTILYIDLRKATLIGKQTIPIWDSGRVDFYNMYGYFIEYNGVTYGSISVNENDLIAKLTNCCGGGIGNFRLHTKVFNRLLN